MNPRQKPTSGSPGARLAAVIALAAAGLIVAFVVAGSLGDDGSDRRDRGGRPAAVAPSGPQEEYYVVKPGDTLSGIAEETEVPVNELQRLNPDIDPQNLLSGQRVRLR